MSESSPPPNEHPSAAFIAPPLDSFDDAETRLDALLEAQSLKRAAAQSKAAASAGISRLESTRRLFRNELLPEVAKLSDKYAKQGVHVDLIAEDFLAGGRELSLIVEFHGAGLRFDGTVTPTSIAFRQTRYTDFDRGGLTASGPTLRTRDLTVQRFRAFVCERIAALVQATLGRSA